jgi:UDP-galactose transporter B1
LVNVTITITRKFLTILISNIAFGHNLSAMQWAGCSLVFAGLMAKPLTSQRTEMKPKEGGKALLSGGDDKKTD